MSEQKKNCLFCEIAARKEQAEVVYQNEQVMAFKDIEPKAPTHLLIAPKQHISSLKEAESEHQQLLGEMMLTAKKLARERDAEGYKLVVNVGEKGGQMIKHIHLHLLIGEPKQWP